MIKSWSSPSSSWSLSDRILGVVTAAVARSSGATTEVVAVTWSALTAPVVVMSPEDVMLFVAIG